MSIQNFSPRYLKAQIVFQLGETTFDMGEQLFNTFGVTGIKWEKFDALETVGKKVSVYLLVKTSTPFKISCPGTLTCEATDQQRYLGISLILSAADIANINVSIEKEGILPDFVRKHPRIPYLHRIGMMPFNTLVEFSLAKQKVNCVCQLDNISPSGFQVYTEDVRAKALFPGESIRISFMPRGEHFLPVNIAAIIRRMTQSRDPISNNMRYFLGMSIGSITEDERLNYTILLRKIVEELRITN